ncbi:esterase [Lactobacillus sp. PV037]|uniref:GDSL-type esterase/lipase family protein n=1 Tax=unclassified Lactobacillus TaxID=2620435 RepID=UPI002240019B|nr:MULTISPECIES: GDSL-type esterase/lipase family protein [unclassified Lactobacillus]QNQ81662.1 esterase [Lactobacillus sp. PV012]QNQ84291.1 esterase [Lactobacillus sp. PV037]
MKILLTGDSILARHEEFDEPAINHFLSQKFPQAKLINTAYPGLNSGGLCVSANKRILQPEKCDYLVILIGTNDLATHKQVPLEQFKANLQFLVSSIIWRYSPKRVIFVSPPAVDETKQEVRSNTLVEKYSQVIIEVCDQYQLTHIDLFKAMLEHGNLPELCHGLKNDGLHFGEAGYLLLSDLLATAIEKTL